MSYTSPPPVTTSSGHLPLSRRTGFRGFIHKLNQQRALVWMSVPFLIWLLIFKYLPLWGWAIAFQDFKPARKLLDQQWVGLKHFRFLFQDEHFLRVMRNTLAMSFINLVLGFVTAITLAIAASDCVQASGVDDQLLATFYFVGSCGQHY